MYVIKLKSEAKWVARSGLPSSYTRDLQQAKTYETREAAELDACGNEVVQSLEEIFAG